jgi:polysaccharide biosynthesis/export protein
MLNRIILFAFLLSVTSCIPYKDLVMFRRTETPLPYIEPLSSLNKVDLTIQPDDMLSITVSCYDPQLAVPFNLVDTRQAGNTQANSPLVTYLVDSKGDIEYPVLGRIHVGKKTIIEIRDTLYAKIKPYIKEPSINIKRVNFRISVLGEVAKPSFFNINSERITLLEALGMAGDMTPYSDRQRVMVVREENGKMVFGRVDLQSTDFFTSPYYYLHQNDVVYVDPKKNKKGTVNDPAAKYINWGTAALSAVSAVLTVIILSKRP